mmetsp:Transcript_773/g.2193  ORF Transcript_773/g.2193 Transcript_773/m.2193 type:complete len:239 (-) Transcript_773:332-1048(-)
MLPTCSGTTFTQELGRIRTAWVTGIAAELQGICKSQSQGFRLCVQGRFAQRWILVFALQQIQCHQRSNALSWRRALPESEAVICRADGVNTRSHVRSKIVLVQKPTSLGCSLHNGISDPTRVETTVSSMFAQGTKGLSKIWILEDVPNERRSTSRQKSVARARLQHFLTFFPSARDAWRHWKTLLCQLDGRLQDGGERQVPPPRDGSLPRRCGSRHGDAEPAQWWQFGATLHLRMVPN